MNKTETITIKNRQDLTEKEQVNIMALIKTETKPRAGNQSPEVKYTCTDGSVWHGGYKAEAFNHELKIQIRIGLEKKYHQMQAPPEMWNIIARSISACGAFKSCHYIYLPAAKEGDNKHEFLETQVQEFLYLHPAMDEKALWATILKNGHGWYTISYGDIDIYGGHRLEKEEITLTPVKLMLSKMAVLKLQLEELPNYE